MVVRSESHLEIFPNFLAIMKFFQSKIQIGQPVKVYSGVEEIKNTISWSFLCRDSGLFLRFV